MLLVSRCAVCARPGRPVCHGCLAGAGPAPALPAPLHVDECVAALDYHRCGHLLTALKTGNRRDLVAGLAAHLARRHVPAPGAIVTWAPTTPARRRQRGFDQAELLARALARRWGRPCRPLLRRAASAQAGRTVGERRANPAFLAPAPVPAQVVVVDDVATTGATLTAAARALRAAGAARVTAVVVARSAGHHPICGP